MVAITSALKRFFKPKKKEPNAPMASPDSAPSASSSTPMLEWESQVAARCLHPSPARISPPPVLTLPRRAPPLFDPGPEPRAPALADPTGHPRSNRVSTNTFRSRRVSTNRTFDGKALAQRSLVPTRAFSAPRPTETVGVEHPQGVGCVGSGDGVPSAGGLLPALLDQEDSAIQYEVKGAAASAVLTLCDQSPPGPETLGVAITRARYWTSCLQGSSMSNTAPECNVPSSLHRLNSPSTAPRPSTPVWDSKQQAVSGEPDPLLIPAYGPTIPNRPVTATSPRSSHAPRTPERRPAARIQFRWSPTITPGRPNTLFGDMDFGEYVSRCLQTPLERPRSPCGNPARSGTFITRSGCKGAGASECDPKAEADPQLAAGVESMFQPVFRQRVVSRQPRCPVSLFDLMEVEESPTARLRARGLPRPPSVAVMEEEVGICLGSEAAKGHGDIVDGEVEDDSAKYEKEDVGEDSVEEEPEGTAESAEGEEKEVNAVLAEQEGSTGQVNVTVLLHEGEKERYPHVADASDDPPAVQFEDPEAPKGAHGERSDDEDWYEDRNWWPSGLAAS